MNVLRLVREDELQQTIEDLLDLYGWLWHHEVDSRKSKRGLPDLVCVRSPVVYFIEAKTENGRVQPEQARWGALLSACTEVRYRLVRPSGLPGLVDELRASGRE